MKTSRTSTHSTPKKPQKLLPQSNQINFNNCCAIKQLQNWKIIAKNRSKSTKKFINLTINDKVSSKNSNQSSRYIQSKTTNSRILSKQSSRQLFQKVKKDFIQQLKLWKQQDPSNKLHKKGQNTINPQIETLKEHEKYLNQQFQQGDFQFNNFHFQEQDFRNKSQKKWMNHDLNSIEEVQINYETTDGLRTQNSARRGIKLTFQ